MPLEAHWPEKLGSAARRGPDEGRGVWFAARRRSGLTAREGRCRRPAWGVRQWGLALSGSSGLLSERLPPFEEQARLRKRRSEGRPPLPPLRRAADLGGPPAMERQEPAAMVLSGHRRYNEVGGGQKRSGSYGNVFLAIDAVTQGAVAIKRQRIPSDTAETEFAAYCAVRRWPHPNVQRMLDHFVSRDQHGQHLLHTVHDSWRFAHAHQPIQNRCRGSWFRSGQSRETAEQQT